VNYYYSEGVKNKEFKLPVWEGEKYEDEYLEKNYIFTIKSQEKTENCVLLTPLRMLSELENENLWKFKLQDQKSNIFWPAFCLRTLNFTLQTTNEFLSHKLLLGQMHWRIPKNVRQFKA
jgi:hypothetical protein